MDAQQPRIGIIGFGRMVEVAHLPGLREAGWDVAAVLDITEARRELGRRSGVGFATDSLEAFLAQDLDAALIGTHSSVRADVAIPCAEAGLHVLVDKPLSTTGDEAERICRTCEDRGVLLSVFHNRRWDPDAILVRELISSNVLGRIVYVENRSFHGETAVGFGAVDFQQHWRVTASLGGGTLLDFGPHWLDQILTAFDSAGIVRSISADVRHLHHGDADDHFTITMTFEDGLRAVAAKSDVCPVGPQTKWFLIGEHGSAVYECDQLIARTLSGQERVFASPVPGPSIYANFMDAISGRAPLLVTGRQSLRTCRIIDAARQAALRRTCISTSI